MATALSSGQIYFKSKSQIGASDQPVDILLNLLLLL